MPLRLKSLELHGYKTFAGRTVFQFAEGITAIVGPNGSGKSNIADAMRWVMGEQSYSLLRAKKTEDMIFSGSEKRTRSGLASATVTFDNTDNWLPVDFSEVALARRAYRDGRNEYLLNGQHVRLREINELLAQSGLSERTYTIMGQGLVDASLSLKADERRRLFEEAAGVGLYRARREEALRRLEITKRNLERVLDIMTELEPRLRTLERQARRAQEYGQVQADLRVLLRDWYGYHWHQAQRALTESRENMRVYESKLSEAREIYQSHQKKYTALREKIHELRSSLSAWYRQTSELHSQRETFSRTLAVLEERRRSLLATQQVIIREQERSRDEERVALERLAETEQDTARLQAEHDDAHSQTEAARQTLMAKQSERAQADEKLLVVRQKLNALIAQRAELQARLDELQPRIENQQLKLQTVEEAIKVAEQTVHKAEKMHRAALLARVKAEKSCQMAETALKEQQKKTAWIEDIKNQRMNDRSSLETDHSRLKAQLEIVEQAEKSLTGYVEGARFLLEAARQARLKGTRGALSTALEVPTEFEMAIAAALGDHLDAILLESEEEAEQALELLESEKAGRAALLPLAWLTKPYPVKIPKDADCLGLASDLVKIPDELRPVIDLLLGQVLVVRDRKAARRLVKGQDAHLRAVTLRGEVFCADGTVLAGQQTHSGTLSRPRQRRELKHALDDLVEHIARLDESLMHLIGEVEEAQRERSRREEALRTAKTRLEEAQKAELEAMLNIESAHRQHDWQKSQKSQLQAEITQAKSKRQQTMEALSLVESRETQSFEEIRSLSTVLARLSLDELQNQVAYWSTRVAVAERALSDAQSRQSERNQVLIRLKDQQENLHARLEESNQSLIELETQRDVLHQQENDLIERLEALQDQIKPAELELEIFVQQEFKQQECELSAQRMLTTDERQYTQAQLDVTRRQESLDSLRQRIEDDFGLVIFEYGDDVSGPVPLPFDGMVEQLPVVTKLPLDLEDQVTQQRARLRRMGLVNPEAKMEYDSEHERYEFLKTQVSDLQKAETDLRQVINELDDLTKSEFLKTFEAVASEFREIFVRLFGGGSAKLMLTDPENLIETGIDIEARLPGRREQGLALLSGGERSLTAIALVFSLLRVSPTPVCVLDEVDAMLDEANTNRFRDLLLELSKDTQFVIVTHNRNTVQAADVIYGVTMGRDSTSQVISLKLDEISDKILKG